MIRIFPDDSKEKEDKYLLLDDKYYLLEHKRGLNKSIYIEGKEWNYYCANNDISDIPHDYDKSKTLDTFYWFWNDFRVFELTKDERIVVRSMEELVN